MIRILKLWEGKYSMWNTEKCVIVYWLFSGHVIFISMNMANAEEKKLSPKECF